MGLTEVIEEVVIFDAFETRFREDSLACSRRKQMLLCVFSHVISIMKQ